MRQEGGNSLVVFVMLVSPTLFKKKNRWKGKGERLASVV